MKNIFTIIFLLQVLLMCSCSSMPSSFRQSWVIPKNAERTVRLAEVIVDRQGGWDSLEREVAALAPMYFGRRGYQLVETSDLADYAARINLREREYSVGWRTRRSLALEVMISTGGEGELPYTIPLAAGRVVAIGDKSFSSSKTTGTMLSRAINGTLRKLASAGKEK